MGDQIAPVFLLGPTASGKTACSIELAKQLDAEIISVDSALVYRDMNIGTAKPDVNEQAGIPHHLIDICNPDEAYSVARFCDDALRVIQDVESRNKRALLTGGTMLYFQALEHGIAPLPEANAEVRAVISKEASMKGWPAMHKRLQQIDPAAADRIHPNDPQRIQRALEVFELTGVAMSELQTNTKPMLNTKPVKFALVPADRAWLHERIGIRFSLMLDAGFIEEVESLVNKYRLEPSLPSMRSVGYRQVWEFIRKETDRQTMIARAEAATRQLAKRQFTWIRGMQGLCELACDTLSTQEQVSVILDEL